ncbi:MAG: sulfite exporter TauE/SafE family protein [Phycisphaerae bacterium]
MNLAVMSPDVSQLITLLVIGGGAGVLGGLLGIGGGLVMIPAMVLLFDDFGDQVYGRNSLHLYKLAALATAAVLSIPAVRQHARAGAIVPAMLKGMIPFGLVGVVLGVGLGRLFADEYTAILRRAFGVFMLLSVVANVWQRRGRRRADSHGRDSCPSPNRWGRIGAVVGLPAGVIAGLLGVGGGIWAVPAQNYLLGVRLPNAIANSAGMIVGLAAGATVVQSLAIAHLHDAQVPVWQGFWLAVWLAPGAIIGGWFGAKLTHRLPAEWLRNVFHVLLILTGLRLIFF